MPEKVDECVESILADNPEMDKSTAFAICQDQMSETKCLTMMSELGLDLEEAKTAISLLREKADASDLSVGDWVMINIGNESTLGRISGEAKESRTEEGNTIDGEDGVADVFRVDVWDAEAEELDESVIHPASRLDPRDAPDAFSDKAELPEDERIPPESAEKMDEMESEMAQNRFEEDV